MERRLSIKNLYDADKPTTINYVASPTGAKFHMDNSRFREIMGPVGSGKSVTCCWEMLKRGLEQEPQADGWRRYRWVVVRNTYPELKSTTIETWLSWFPEEVYGKIKWDTPIRHNITIHEYKLKLEVWFMAVDRTDERKLLSLEMSAIWFNEAREIPFNIFNRATERVGRYPKKEDGGCKWSGIIMDTNPPDTDHWLYRVFEEKKTPDGQPMKNAHMYSIFHQPPGLIENENGELITNPEAENLHNLEEGYYINQVGTKSMEELRVYAMGYYGYVGHGKPVYPEYNDELHYTVGEIEPQLGETLYLGFDFGLDPCCIIAQYIYGRLYLIEELICHDTSIEEFCESVLLPKLNSKYKDYTYEAVGDPSGSFRKDTDASYAFMTLSKFGIKATPARTNKVVTRINAVKHFLNKMAQGKPAFAIGTGCPTLRKGFMGNYKFKRVQVIGDERYRDEPDKNEYSHIHDALQYACLRLTNNATKTNTVAVPFKGNSGGWMAG